MVVGFTTTYAISAYQFHQYQQNEQSLILTELIKHKKTTTCGIRNPGLGFGPGTKMNIQPVKGIPTHPS
jgi:hypothetical protein